MKEKAVIKQTSPTTGLLIVLTLPQFVPQYTLDGNFDGKAQKDYIVINFL